MESMGSKEPKRRYGPKIIASGLAAAAVVASAAVFENHRDPESTYAARYTDNGKCLDFTPYDPDQGASLNMAREEGTDVLTVVPRDANTYTPSVLVFVIDHNGLFQPDLMPADYSTGSFMHNANCPDQPEGY